MKFEGKEQEIVEDLRKTAGVERGGSLDEAGAAPQAAEAKDEKDILLIHDEQSGSEGIFLRKAAGVERGDTLDEAQAAPQAAQAEVTMKKQSHSVSSIRTTSVIRI